MNNLFLKPEKPFLVCFQINKTRDYIWCESEEEVIEAIEDYKRSYDSFVIDDVIEIGSCKPLNLIVNSEGKVFTESAYEAAVTYMDDDIREDLHSKLAPCSNQEFFTAYEKAHEEKFEEEWELSKFNPSW